MKSAIMQPYFFPYFGYFQLINRVDTFVIYGNVSFRKRSYISRNSILDAHGCNEIINLEVTKASSFKNINELEINKSDWRRKFLKKIEIYYSRYPHYSEVREIIDRIFINSNDNLSDFNALGIQEISKALEIESTIIYNDVFFEEIETSLNKEFLNSKKEERIIGICKKIESDNYINPIGGVSLYNKDLFHKNGIKLDFFISNLKGSPSTNSDMNSIIHFLMDKGLDRANSMLNGGELI